MSEINDKSRVHDYVTTHIDEAIANEWIKVYYQPVVRALTGQLCGAESLARWIDPEVGLFTTYSATRCRYMIRVRSSV